MTGSAEFSQQRSGVLLERDLNLERATQTPTQQKYGACAQTNSALVALKLCVKTFPRGSRGRGRPSPWNRPWVWCATAQRLNRSLLLLFR